MKVTARLSYWRVLPAISRHQTEHLSEEHLYGVTQRGNQGFQVEDGELVE